MGSCSAKELWLPYAKGSQMAASPPSLAPMPPLRFRPIFKSPLWSGHDIVQLKHLALSFPIGESWEVSGVPGEETYVEEGEMAGKCLSDLLRDQGAELMGARNFRRFGDAFPLLIKFISAAQPLSVQVHPDNAMAQRVECQRFGKTEMWFILDTHPEATLCAGFNVPMTMADFDRHMAEGTLHDVLSFRPTHHGEVYFLPAGQIHSIGSGNLIIEIQQSSDLTYRVYDFDRTDAQGRKRALHLDRAREAIRYDRPPIQPHRYPPTLNCRVPLIACPEFTTAHYCCTAPLRADFRAIESFVVLIAYAGRALLTDHEGHTVTLQAGETIFFPATTLWVDIRPEGTTPFSCLETFVDPDLTDEG